jgi:SAM-dependent methyltransferase
MTSVDRPVGEVFDDVAEDYDEVREGYPTEIVASALDRGRLGDRARILEVGCGTGKLTEVLVALGVRVDAVDPGARMIAAAQRRLGAADAVTFHVGRFEELALPHQAFDAVFSATAFHWLDSRVSWSKAASHLKPGGLLALLTHTAVHDERSAEAEAGFRALLREYAPSVAAGWPPPRDLETLLAGAKQRTLDEVLAHFRTTSLYFQIEPDKRQEFEDGDRRLIESGGGSVHFSEAIVLMTAFLAKARPTPAQRSRKR